MNHFQGFWQKSSLRYPKSLNLNDALRWPKGQEQWLNNYPPCSGLFVLETRESSRRKATSSKVPLE